MQEIRLKRTKHEDLVFTGELLAEVIDLDPDGFRTVGLKLALYQTRVGAHILAVTVHDYRTSGSKIFYCALSFSSVKGIYDFVISREGLGLADSVLLLLDQAAKTAKPAINRRQQFIPDQAARGQSYPRHPG